MTNVGIFGLKNLMENHLYVRAPLKNKCKVYLKIEIINEHLLSALCTFVQFNISSSLFGAIAVQNKHKEGFRTLVESLVLMTHLYFTNFLEIGYSLKWLLP